jgi:NADPH-dependent glutamate synthase beta subunit-like oxidoreductase/CO/xanthine dehydrogenase FAD-binding subunit
MRKFTYVRATKIEEAVSALSKTAKVIAGGTDLVGAMKDDIHPIYPKTLVGIKSIAGLEYIRQEEGMLRIGALARLADIAENSTIKSNYRALAEAALKVATPQIREMGTIGGNLCQEVRCWYYRNPDNRFFCLRKGGKECAAITGDARYHSIFGSIRVCRTPCSVECPDNIDIPDYIDKLRGGDITGAAQILLVTNPLPAITGRICPHFCETQCNRVGYDEAVSIKGIERYVGDYILEHPELIYKPKKTGGKKLAIIGSGPAGLSAAYYLNQLGYTVTVMEKLAEAGGLLRYGIPPYRLPRNVVTKQIKMLRAAGIQFHTGVKDINVGELSKSYAGVFIACGAWKERRAGIKGEEYLKSGLEFLKGFSLRNSQVPGKRIGVIGGGNVAIDVARTLRRLGAEPVVLYRRGRAEMPAIREEVEKAEQEGIQFQFLTLPVGAEKEMGRIILKCVEIRLGAPDGTGRPRPEPVSGFEFTLQFEAVYAALGEEPDLEIVPKAYRDSLGRIKAEKLTGLLGDNVFAGGDFISGPSTVVQAIDSGRKAAASINVYLGGKITRSSGRQNRKSLEKFNSAYLGKTVRVVTPELEVNERVRDLDSEDIGNLEPEAVLTESNRCFNCGCVALNASDLAPVLIALGANIQTSRRVIPAEKFFTVEEEKTTVLANDEIITEIQVPTPMAGTEQNFIKCSIRESIDFALVSVATAIVNSGGKVTDARIVLGAVAPIPYRALAAENILKGKVIDVALAEKAGEAAVQDAVMLSNNKYKFQISRALVKRAILGLSE